MIGVLAIIMTAIAFGLYTSGSGMLAALVVVVACGLWWLADAVEWDAELLGALVVVVGVIIMALIGVRALFLYTIGFL